MSTVTKHTRTVFVNPLIIGDKEVQVSLSQSIWVVVRNHSQFGFNDLIFFKSLIPEIQNSESICLFGFIN